MKDTFESIVSLIVGIMVISFVFGLLKGLFGW